MAYRDNGDHGLSVAQDECPAFRKQGGNLPPPGTPAWEEQHEKDLESTPEDLEKRDHTLSLEEWHEILCAFDGVRDIPPESRKSHSPSRMPDRPLPAPSGPECDREIRRRYRERLSTRHPEDPRYIHPEGVSDEPIEASYDADCD